MKVTNPTGPTNYSNPPVCPAACPQDYVQHHLEREADTVWALLGEQAGGYLYVCGDAKNMARDVQRSLVHLAKARLPGGTDAEADAWLRRLQDSGRYQRDVW